MPSQRKCAVACICFLLYGCRQIGSYSSLEENISLGLHLFDTTDKLFEPCLSSLDCVVALNGLSFDLALEIMVH